MSGSPRSEGVFFFAVVIVLLFDSPAFADFSGRVVGVTDGDTIKVMHIGRAEKIRLYGIDCPEREQLTVTRPSSSPPRWGSARRYESRSSISTQTGERLRMLSFAMAAC